MFKKKKNISTIVMLVISPTALYFEFAVAGLLTHIKKIKLKNILHKSPPQQRTIYNSQTFKHVQIRNCQFFPTSHSAMMFLYIYFIFILFFNYNKLIFSCI